LIGGLFVRLIEVDLVRFTKKVMIFDHFSYRICLRGESFMLHFSSKPLSWV